MGVAAGAVPEDPAEMELPVAGVPTLADAAALEAAALLEDDEVPSAGLIPVNVPDNREFEDVVPGRLPEPLVARLPPDVGNDAAAPVDGVKEEAGDASPVADAAAAVVAAALDVPNAGTEAAAPVELLALI
jgi:hypothetical protein